MSLSTFLNQTLTPLELDTGRSDLGTATVKKILFKKPSGSTGEWIATVSGTKLQYVFVDGDLNEVGYWRVRTYLEISGKKGWGPWQTMQVVK